MPLQCTCQRCGKPFFTYASEIRKGGGKYCSRACYDLLRRERRPEESPRWKGGRSVTPRGYVYLMRSNANPIYEHRWVMEQHLGRPLRTDEHVHHINGIKADNRIENLQVIDQPTHSRMHASGPRLTGWAKEHDRCAKCGQTEERHWARGLCKSCYDKQRHSR